MISDLEDQIRILREELIQANSLRDQQLLNLSLQKNEEMKAAVRDKEVALSSLKMEMENAMLELKKRHQAETEAALDKASSRLKQTEQEYSLKLAKSSQEITVLKTTISSLMEENNLQQLAAEQRLQDVAQKLEDEKQQLMEDNDRTIKEGQHHLSYKFLFVMLQLITIREEYEKILKGLMPASSKKDFEDTISSLKSQVSSYYSSSAFGAG
uniref:Uncharacterized protein n=1 Tax=Malurus cyaneus samueli TaxID=2593467 RepID=A0A8C5TB17_9PASS